MVQPTASFSFCIPAGVGIEQAVQSFRSWCARRAFCACEVNRVPIHTARAPGERAAGPPGAPGRWAGELSVLPTGERPALSSPPARPPHR